MNDIVKSGGVPPAVASLGMIIDAASAYEDAIYWKFTKDLPTSDRLANIQGSINNLDKVFNTGLRLSYDPVLRSHDITVAQEEFDLFKAVVPQSPLTGGSRVRRRCKKTKERRCKKTKKRRPSKKSKDTKRRRKYKK